MKARQLVETAYGAKFDSKYKAYSGYDEHGDVINLEIFIVGHGLERWFLQMGKPFGTKYAFWRVGNLDDPELSDTTLCEYEEVSDGEFQELFEKTIAEAAVEILSAGSNWRARDITEENTHE